MRTYLQTAISLFFLISIFTGVIAQEKAYPGPVFDTQGPVYDVTDVDFIPNTDQELKAIFDIVRVANDPSGVNGVISSLHRYYNMHVRKGIREGNIHLAFVVHGKSGKDVLTNKAYKERYGIDNPNLEFIQSLNEKGVQMFICGQSAAGSGFIKEEITPEVKVALSAMTVLTVFQMDDYAMIKF